MITWKAQLDNKEIYNGYSDDGSWKTLKNIVENSEINHKIISLELDLKGVGGGNIDSSRDGYFLGNKIIACLDGGKQVNLVGIGYWERLSETVRIKWYNSDTMELVMTEARSTKEAGFFLIRNPV